MAGGGTAGHTSPLLATADALRREDASVEVTALGTPRGLEVRVVPEVDIEDFTKSVEVALNKLGIKSQRSEKLSLARARIVSERLTQARNRLED